MENPEIARTAARTISALDQPVASLLDADPRALEALPGIGPKRARLIDETLGVRTLPQTRTCGARRQAVDTPRYWCAPGGHNTRHLAAFRALLRK